MNRPIAPTMLLNMLPEEPYNPPIGELLGPDGGLSSEDIARVREKQDREHLRFGAAAVALGLATPDDVHCALAQQYRFPALHSEVSTMSPELVCAVDPDNAVAGAIQRLRTELLLRLRQTRGPNSIAIIGAERGEGRSFIAANLAIAFAQLNLRTMLIDSDLRTGRLGQLFAMDERRGLSSLLIGRAALEHVVPVASHETLSVMGRGPLPPNPQELLSTERFNQLLVVVRDVYDVVIVDTPAWSSGVDAQVVGAACRSALVVSRPRRAALRQRTDDLRRRLSSSGTEIIGALINDF